LLSGDNTGFAGAIECYDALQFITPENLGSASITIGAGGTFNPLLDLDEPVLAGVEIAAGGGFIIDQVVRFAPGRLTLGGLAVPAGTYDAAALAALWPLGLFTDGGGSVTVEAPAPFTDGDADGMDDGWEIANFGSTTASDGTGDGDGDRQSDLAEFLARTDPRDAASRLAVATVARDAGAGTVSLGWGGRPGVTYRVRSGADLSTWVVEPGTFSGVGPHLWTGNAPAPPVGPRLRYYQVFVVAPAR
jgi:hypothetical protein